MRYAVLLVLLLCCGLVRAQEADTLKDYFIPMDYMHSLGLARAQKETEFRTWLCDQNSNSEVFYVVDIRKVFDSHDSAIKYFSSHLEDEDDNGVPYPFPKNFGIDVEQLHVYRESPVRAIQFAADGQKDAQWYFLFVSGKVMAKVIVVGYNTPYATARTIASKAAEVTAAKQKIRYNNYPLPKYTLPAEMSDLVERAKLIYDAPPGYNENTVRPGAEVKYDYAVIHPSGESEIRYIITPFDSMQKTNTTLSDSAAFMSFFTSVITARGIADKNLPVFTPIKKDKLDKSYNADTGWVTYIQPRGEFGRGYLCCMATCLYKRGVGMVEIYHLATDRKWFSAEPQITPFTVRFSN